MWNEREREREGEGKKNESLNTNEGAILYTPCVVSKISTRLF